MVFGDSSLSLNALSLWNKAKKWTLYVPFFSKTLTIPQNDHQSSTTHESPSKVRLRSGYSLSKSDLHPSGEIIRSPKPLKLYSSGLVFNLLHKNMPCNYYRSAKGLLNCDSYKIEEDSSIIHQQSYSTKESTLSVSGYHDNNSKRVISSSRMISEGLNECNQSIIASNNVRSSIQCVMKQRHIDHLLLYLECMIEDLKDSMKEYSRFTTINISIEGNIGAGKSTFMDFVQSISEKLVFIKSSIISSHGSQCEECMTILKEFDTTSSLPCCPNNESKDSIHDSEEKECLYSKNDEKETTTTTTTTKRDNESLVDFNIDTGVVSESKERLGNDNIEFIFSKEPVDFWSNLYGHNLLGKFYDNPEKFSFPFQILTLFTRIQQMSRSKDHRGGVFSSSVVKRDHSTRKNINPHATSKEDTICSEMNSFGTSSDNHISKQDVLSSNECPSLVQFCISERSMMSDQCFASLCHEDGNIDECLMEIYRYIHSITSGLLSSQGNSSYNAIIYLRSPSELCYDRMKSRARTEENQVPLCYLKRLEEKHDEWLFGWSKVSSEDQTTIFPPPTIIPWSRETTHLLHHDSNSSMYSRINENPMKGQKNITAATAIGSPNRIINYNSYLDSKEYVLDLLVNRSIQYNTESLPSSPPFAIDRLHPIPFNVRLPVSSSSSSSLEDKKENRGDSVTHIHTKNEITKVTLENRITRNLDFFNTVFMCNSQGNALSYNATIHNDKRMPVGKQMNNQDEDCTSFILNNNDKTSSNDTSTEMKTKNSLDDNQRSLHHNECGLFDNTETMKKISIPCIVVDGSVSKENWDEFSFTSRFIEQLIHIMVAIKADLLNNYRKQNSN